MLLKHSAELPSSVDVVQVVDSKVELAVRDVANLSPYWSRIPYLQLLKCNVKQLQ